MRRCYSVSGPLTAWCLSFLPAALLAGQAPVRPPVRPAVCRTLAAAQQLRDGGPEDESSPDTERLQAALNGCPAGEAVELTAAAPANVFLTAPITLPPGVILWVDPGVVLFASRNVSDYLSVDHTARPLISVASSAAADGLPATLAGYGVIDARGGAVLLQASAAGPHTWFDLPVAERPVLLKAAGSVTLAGITLRDAPGIAVRYGGPDLLLPGKLLLPGSLLVEDAKLLGNMAAPSTQALVVASAASDVRVVGSVLAAAGSALALSGAATVSVADTAIYGGSLDGSLGSAPCVARSTPAASGAVLTCQPALLPPLRGELVQTGPEEVAAVLIVPDLGLPLPAGTVDLLEGDAVLLSRPISASAAVFDLSSLPAGPHRLHARIAADDFRFGDLPVTLPRARRADAPPTLTLTASATTMPYGTTLTLTATLPAATRQVSFLDGSTVLGQASMSGGNASFTLSDLSLGPHTVTAFYAGDPANPVQTSPPLLLQVNPVTTIVSLGTLPSSIPYGAVLMLQGSVLPVTAGGTLTFRDEAETLGQATLSGGAAGMSVSGLKPGQHTISAVYGGDRYDLAASSPAVHVNVAQLTTTTSLSATPPSASFGTPVQLAVAVTAADATGLVTVADGVTVLARIPLTAGAGSTQVTTLQPGLHLLTATYAGDVAHLPSASSTVAVQIDRLSTTTSLALLPATPTPNTPLTLSANVIPASATGMVTFTDRNSGPLGQASVAGGIASLTLPSLKAGPHSITASYVGDTEYAGSTSPPSLVTVPLATAGLTLTGLPANVLYAAPERLLAGLKPDGATGSITLTDSVAGPLGTALVAAGSASWALPSLAPGSHLLTALYSGDPSFGPVASSVSISVLPDPTSTELTAAQQSVPAGSPVLLNLRVAEPYSNSPTGTVLVRIGAGTYSASLTHLLAGQSFATLAVDSAALGLGSFTASAQYGGDGYDQPSASAPLSFNITPTPVSLVLTLPSHQITTGVSSQIFATVSSSSGVPTGTLSFYRNGSLIASAPTGNGSASVTLPGLPVGSYDITVSYAPAGLFGPAVVPAQVLYVGLPVEIALSPASLTLQPGASGSSILSVTGFAGFSGPWTATCSSPTSYITCSLDPASAGSTPAAATVHVHAAANTYSQAKRRPGGSALRLLALLVPASLLSTKRSRQMRRQRLALILLSAGLLSTTACGTGTFFNVPPGNWTITVSVTAAGSTVIAPLTVGIAD